MKIKRGRPFGTFKNPVRKSSQVYQRWIGMKQRCLNPKSHIWKYYGGRGITVCERWLTFANFYADMGEPNGLTLDRFPNPDGNYEPSNCRWATMKEQAVTRRPKPVNTESLWGRAKLSGIAYHVVYQRIKLFGWTEERALNTPVQKRGRKTGWRKNAALNYLPT